MIAAILSWTKLPQWALELIVIAAVAGGIWYWQHHLIAEGVAKQVAQDTVDSNKVKEQTAKDTADLKARATTAEQAYDKERLDNANYRSQHPDSVRLCIQPAPRSGVVSTASTPHAGNESSGSAAADVPKVSDGDSGSGAGQAGPDIGALLGLLAGKADDVSAVLREYQTRQGTK